MSIWSICWLVQKRQLKRISKLVDPALPCYDDVEALTAVKSVQTRFLTTRQLAILSRYRVFCHISIGDCQVAKNLLETGAFEPAFKHFALSFISDGEGDYEKAMRELDMASARMDDKTDPFIRIQIEHNRAIEHINDGRFRTANDELERLRTAVKKQGIRNRAFLNLLYENLVLNKTRLGLPDGGAAVGWSLIDEYAALLTADSSVDRGALFNLELMFLRQLGAGREQKVKLFSNEVANTRNDANLSDGQRAIAMASLGRIAWADGFNPSQVLEYFDACDLSFKGLGPENRIFVFKNLFIMLESLITETSLVTNIRNGVVSYFENCIENDLDAWESGLPAEALKKRALILRERAALSQLRGEDFERSVCYLKEAIALLEQGLQCVDALEPRWELAKCMVSYKRDGAEEQVLELEERLEALGDLPALGYPYYEMCLCYGLLGMGRECRAAFARAESFGTAMDHYSPMVRRDYVMATFCARFFLMLEALEAPERVLDCLRTDCGRAWLRSYSVCGNGLALVILLGRFLGLPGKILVERSMANMGEGLAFVHYWMVVPELGLAFDPSIKSGDGRCGGVFPRFEHPLVSKNSNYEALLSRRGFESIPSQIRFCDEADLSTAEITAIRDILDALNIVCDRERPSISDLQHRYCDECHDVLIQE